MKKVWFILALSLGFFVSSPALVSAQVSVSIYASIPPPPLPVYVQPACPYDGYLWNPGYWAWGDDGYYWVPGVWVLPPQPGYLWTPPYWGFAGGRYGYYPGYWGLHVGFYGGVNYGYGYGGSGYGGGRWEGGHFRYNTAVVTVNRTVIHNTYIDRTVIVNNNTRTSFNGGSGGISARPTAQQQAFVRERHIPPTSVQTSHMQVARQDRSSFASANHGTPPTAAMNKPGGNRFDPQGHAPAAHAGTPAARGGTPAATHNPATPGAATGRPANRPTQPAPAVGSDNTHRATNPNPNGATTHTQPSHQPGAGAQRTQPQHAQQQQHVQAQQHMQQQQHAQPQQHMQQQQHAPQQQHVQPQQQHAQPQQQHAAPQERPAPQPREAERPRER
jgi:hypothetical protein